MHFKRTCRCCLNTNAELKSIDFTIEIDGKKETISEIFLNCLNIEMSTDNMPQSVCMYCITTLQISYSFKKIIENSQKVLTQYIENNVPSCDDTNEESLCASNEIFDSKTYFPPTDFEEDTNEQQYDQNKPVNAAIKEENQVRSGKPDVYYFCTVCSNKFLEQTELYDHCCSQHPQTKKNGKPCCYCNERFDDLQSLIVHRTKHLTPHVCTCCWKGFTEEDLLSAHTNICETIIKLPEKTFKSEKPRTKPIQKQVICHFCGKSYPSGYIKVHLLLHSDGQIQCKYCGKTFKQRCNLNSHIIWNHKRERKYKCDFCEFLFMTASARSTHVRKIHNKEKRFPCELCGKPFFGPAGLRKHMLSHTGVKNFTCNHCDKAYQSRNGLNVHLKSNHIQK